MIQELTEKQKKTINLGIVIDPEKLKQISEPIEYIDDKELIKLIDKMEKVLIAAKGLGLAHIQIQEEHPKQIFIMMANEGIEVCINPKIKKSYWQKEFFPEGCLSLPDKKQSAILRPKKIQVEYMTLRNGKVEEVEKELSGMDCRIFQHEMDHLRGAVYLDRI